MNTTKPQASPFEAAEQQSRREHAAVRILEAAFVALLLVIVALLAGCGGGDPEPEPGECVIAGEYPPKPCDWFHIVGTDGGAE
jgi:hypothetical protein